MKRVKEKINQWENKWKEENLKPECLHLGGPEFQFPIEECLKQLSFALWNNLGSDLEWNMLSMTISKLRPEFCRLCSLWNTSSFPIDVCLFNWTVN